MATTDPREAILNHLSGPPGVATKLGEARHGIQAINVSGGPLSSAIRNSVAFLKERAGHNHRLYAVTYIDSDTQRHLDIIGTTEQPDGTWTVTGSAGGSGSVPWPRQPWLNIAACWGDDRFCAGGEVVGTNRDDAARCQLVFADRTIIEDRVERHIVLFLAEHEVELPATVNILDVNQQLLATHSVL